MLVPLERPEAPGTTRLHRCYMLSLRLVLSSGSDGLPVVWEMQ